MSVKSPKLLSIEEELTQLRRELLDHDYRYYVLSQPIISDAEYDALMRRLKDLEAERPDLITPDSPTQRVSGQPVEGFERYRHKRPMMSLDNSYSLDELRDWARRDSKVAAVVREVDAARVKFLHQLYREAGLEGSDIEDFAELHIAYVIGTRLTVDPSDAAEINRRRRIGASLLLPRERAKKR